MLNFCRSWSPSRTLVPESASLMRYHRDQNTHQWCSLVLLRFKTFMRGHRWQHIWIYIIMAYFLYLVLLVFACTLLGFFTTLELLLLALCLRLGGVYLRQQQQQQHRRQRQHRQIQRRRPREQSDNNFSSPTFWAEAKWKEASTEISVAVLLSTLRLQCWLCATFVSTKLRWSYYHILWQLTNQRFVNWGAASRRYDQRQDQHYL